VRSVAAAPAVPGVEPIVVLVDDVPLCVSAEPPPVALPGAAAEPVRAGSAPVSDVLAAEPLSVIPLEVDVAALPSELALPPPVALPGAAAEPVRAASAPVVDVCASDAAKAGPARSATARPAVVMSFRMYVLLQFQELPFVRSTRRASALGGSVHEQKDPPMVPSDERSPCGSSLPRARPARLPAFP